MVRRHPRSVVDDGGDCVPNHEGEIWVSGVEAMGQANLAADFGADRRGRIQDGIMLVGQ